MTNPIAEVGTIWWTPPGETEAVRAYREVRVNCPGCGSAHDFTIKVLDDRYRRPNGKPEPVWAWDGDLEKPTFSSSMLAYGAVHRCKGLHEYVECDGECGERSHHIMWKTPNGALHSVMYKNPPPDGAREVKAHDVSGHTANPAWGNCHSFLRSGVWEFLSDSAHPHAGQKLPVIPLENWMVRENNVN